MAFKQSALEEHLKKYFGFDQFRGLQRSVVTSVLNKEDVFVIMPTGGGKSLMLSITCIDAGRYGDYRLSTYCVDEESGGCHTRYF